MEWYIFPKTYNLFDFIWSKYIQNSYNNMLINLVVIWIWNIIYVHIISYSFSIIQKSMFLKVSHFHHKFLAGISNLGESHCCPSIWDVLSHFSDKCLEIISVEAEVIRDVVKGIAIHASQDVGQSGEGWIIIGHFHVGRVGVSWLTLQESRFGFWWFLYHFGFLGFLGWFRWWFCDFRFLKKNMK